MSLNYTAPLVYSILGLCKRDRHEDEDDGIRCVVFEIWISGSGFQGRRCAQGDTFAFRWNPYGDIYRSVIAKRTVKPFLHATHISWITKYIFEFGEKKTRIRFVCLLSVGIVFAFQTIIQRRALLCRSLNQGILPQVCLAFTEPRRTYNATAL